MKSVKVVAVSNKKDDRFFTTARGCQIIIEAELYSVHRLPSDITFIDKIKEQMK